METLVARRVPRRAPPEVIRQLVVTERSDVEAIDSWLKKRDRDVMVVATTIVNDTVRTCVQHAREIGLDIMFQSPAVQVTVLASIQA